MQNVDPQFKNTVLVRIALCLFQHILYLEIAKPDATSVWLSKANFPKLYFLFWLRFDGKGRFPCV